LTLPVPDRPAGSRTVTLSVCPPSGTTRESYGNDTGPELVLVVFPAARPSIEAENVLVPSAAPPTHTVVHAVPVTIAPAFGLVIVTVRLPAPLPVVIVNVNAFDVAAAGEGL
jgi:hypothetical protein